jgi:Zn-dependent peptidase ImmA (M78 family)
MKRLAKAGFKKDFVRSAILPDWWDESCQEDASLLLDLELRVARFLTVPLEAVRNEAGALSPPTYAGAQLRRVRDLERDRLAPAIHAALRVAGAVVRSLREQVTPAAPPAAGLEWRAGITRPTTTISLDQMLGDLWRRGIPVVPLEHTPAPSFQGLACIVEARPVVLLGHKNDEPGRVAFLVAHEAGHIAWGDCSADCPVVDEEEEIGDDADIETRADLFARQVLVGTSELPRIDAQSYKELAQRALDLEKSHGVDASTAIFAWAQRTRDYAKATLAVKAIYRHIGARRKLREHFDTHVDVGAASDSDRALLRCVFGAQEHDEAAD